MASLYDRLNQVRWLGRRARDAALVATLPHAGPKERDALVLEMIQVASASPASRHLFGTLLRNWRLLSQPSREAVLGCLGTDLTRVFEQLRQSEESADKQAAAMIAVACLSGEFQNQSEAEGAGPNSRELNLSDPAIRSELDAALAEAARRFAEDRQESVTSAIARVAHRAGPKLREWLEDEQQVGHLALRSAAKRLPREIQVRHAAWWLGIPPLRSVAVAIIESFSPEELAEGVLERAHLLRTRRRDSAIRRVSRNFSLVPAHPAVLALTSRQRCASIDVASSLRWLEDKLRTYFSSFLLDPDATVRFRAVTRLGELSAKPESDASILDFAFDADEWVASKATSILTNAPSAARRRALHGAYDNLLKSPHARVRALASLALRGVDPLAEALDAWCCPIAARFALSQDRAGFLRELESRASEGRVTNRIAAFELADRLNVLETLEPVLVRAARELDRRLASKATVLLGKLPGDGPREAIRAALRHTDERIRANAVEALATADPEDPRIEVLLSDPSSRVRANALRALLAQPARAPIAENALAVMLIDDRPSHRVSALWVTERTGRTALASRVADLASADDSPEVHDRAKRCARRLLAQMRVGWAKSDSNPPPVEVISRPLANAG